MYRMPMIYFLRVFEAHYNEKKNINISDFFNNY